MKIQLLRLFVVISIAFSVIVAGTIAVTENVILEIEKDMLENKINQVKVASSETEAFFDHLVDILVLTSLDSTVQHTQYEHLITEELRGIPEDQDISKRELAREILSKNPAFETIAFVLPNGDMYFTEPYSKQQSLTRLNWDHRDWYQGTVSTMAPYISEVYNATATRTYAVSVNIPVITETGEFLGLWRSVIDLDKLYESVDFVDTEYLIFFDHKGTELPISLGIHEEQKPRDVSNFQSTQFSLDGKSGTIKEISNDGEYVVAYAPIEITSHLWGHY